MSRATINIDSIVDTEDRNIWSGDEEKVVKLYKQGARVVDIIEGEGLAGSQTLYDILHRNNVPLRGGRNGATIVKENSNKTAIEKNKRREKQVVKEYKQGKTLKEITKNNGITAPTIYRILKDHKVKLRTDYVSDENKPTQPIHIQEEIHEEPISHTQGLDAKNNLIRERDKTITSLKKTLKVAIGLNIVALIVFITYAIMVI